MYKKTPYNSIILATLFQSYDKFTQTVELSFIPKNGGLTLWTSPRLWNLYLALSKGLSVKKIELYGVFLSSAIILLQKISGV